MKTEVEKILAFFDSSVNNIKENKTIIDHKYIRHLIKSWKIKDMAIDESGKITNQYAVNDLEKIMKQIDNVALENIFYILLLKNNVEIRNAIFNKNFEKGIILVNICMGIQNNYFSKVNKNKLNEIIINRLTKAMIDNYQGIILSYSSGDYSTVIQKSRIIYENYIISLFISANKELSEPFLDHGKIMKYKLLKKIKEHSLNEKAEIKQLLNKYGRDFYDDYGWTKKVIGEKNNRKLLNIANKLGVGKELNFIYKLSSMLLHANSLNISIKEKDGLVDETLNISNRFLTRQILLYINEIGIAKSEIDFITALLLNKFENG